MSSKSDLESIIDTEACSIYYYFRAEGGGSMVHQNFGIFLQVHTALLLGISTVFLEKSSPDPFHLYFKETAPIINVFVVKACVSLLPSIRFTYHFIAITKKVIIFLC